MAKFNLIQTQLNALRDGVVDTVTIGEFKTQALAEDFLTKRDYKFDTVANAWIRGNTVHFPVTIEEVVQSLFDIRSFV